MAVVRCSQGHYYDNEKFSRCPYCGIFTNLNQNEKQKGREEKEEKTVAISQGEPLEEALRKTVALKPEGGPCSDDQKTIGYFSPDKGNDFVTGWLVCTRGKERGRDYRLHHGFNRIGRSYQMSVSIVDDIHISQENHCSVVYDHKSNTFFLVPSEGNLVYLGGELVKKPAKLSTGDIMALGDSEFEFIAYCREEKKWEEE